MVDTASSTLMRGSAEPQTSDILIRWISKLECLIAILPTFASQGCGTNVPSNHGFHNTLELCSRYNWGLAWLVNFLAFIVYADL